jgi:flagellar motor switch protein FliN
MGDLGLPTRSEAVASTQDAGVIVGQDSRAGRDRVPPVEIDRVIDVPLAVTLRFGQREMRLREVVELSAGSLIELDRQIEDPVDLLLGDRIIARGEVVIVDGNYGLRVTEVLQSESGLSQ